MSHQTNRMGICREEFVALTRDPLIAMVLNQLLYWTQRVKDYDLYLKEERGVTPALEHGWIYKTSDELSEESMVGVSRGTMRKYLAFLKEEGWIETRSNPSAGWDKTIQYRVNLRLLEADLFAKGYKLPECFLPPEELGTGQKASLVKSDPCMHKTETEDAPTPQNCSMSKIDHAMDKIDPCIVKSDHSMVKNGTALVKSDHSYTYTETTTETKDKDYSQRLSAQAFLEKMIEAWKGCVPFDCTHATEERKLQLQAVLKDHFQSDIAEWERFCERVKASPFLMGGGPNKWRVSLDWALKKDNLIKILEGKYDNPKQIEAAKEETCRVAQNYEVAQVLSSIKDPVWKKWCTQLTEGVRLSGTTMLENPLPLSDLKAIADAWFIECEEERLVWIGSHHMRVLSRIDDLAFKINWVFKKDYPNARTFRTRLVGG